MTEIAGMGAFSIGSRVSTLACPLGRERVVLLTSIKTGIGTSAPELEIASVISKTPNPTFSGACKPGTEK